MQDLKTVFPSIDYKTRFPALDGVRALAVTMVFLLHFGGGAHGGMVLRLVNLVRLRLGIGVDLFFVLSGFLITGILFDTTADSHYFKRFFARRTVRILPAYYLLFAVLALLTPLLRYGWHADQLSFLLYVVNIVGPFQFDVYVLHSAFTPAANATLAHLWSLCVEEQFYLLWPLLIFAVRDRVKLIWASVALCLVALGLRVWLLHAMGPHAAAVWLFQNLPFRLDSLIIGGLLALLLRGPGADRIQRSCRWVLLVGLAGMLLAFSYAEDFVSWQYMSYGLTATAIASAGLIGMALRTGSLTFRLFSLRWLRVIGKYSYGFYIWHLVFYEAWLQLLILLTHRMHSAVIAGLITLPLAYGVTFLVAKASFDLFEVRFLKIKRHFEYDSELRTGKTAFAPDGR